MYNVTTKDLIFAVELRNVEMYDTSVSLASGRSPTKWSKINILKSDKWLTKDGNTWKTFTQTQLTHACVNNQI